MLIKKTYFIFIISSLIVSIGCSNQSIEPSVKVKNKTVSPPIITLNAITDFDEVSTSDRQKYVPSYIDDNTHSRGVNAEFHKDKTANVESSFAGKSGIYTLKLTALTEIDGESLYSINIGPKKLPVKANSVTDKDYNAQLHIWKNIEVIHGEKIQVEFNSHTNGKIPEGESTAYSRGRWTKLELICEALCDHSTTPNNNIYVEKNGLVSIDLSSVPSISENWQVVDSADAISDSYIKWIGDDYYNEPGVSVMVLNVQINDPGTYQFLWRNLITAGDSTTDANDSWLKIVSTKFYAAELSSTSIVCPYDHDSNTCKGEEPEGAGANGWFKVYRYGGPADQWTWATATNDNHPHIIYADFEQAGTYQVLVSARSKAHAIDRLVLFRHGNEKRNVSMEDATKG